MSAPIGPGDWVECVGPFNGAAGLAAAGAKVIGEYRVGMVALCEAVTPRMQLPDGRPACIRCDGVGHLSGESQCRRCLGSGEQPNPFGEPS